MILSKLNLFYDSKIVVKIKKFAAITTNVFLSPLLMTSGSGSLFISHQLLLFFPLSLSPSPFLSLLNLQVHFFVSLSLSPLSTILFGKVVGTSSLFSQSNWQGQKTATIFLSPFLSQNAKKRSGERRSKGLKKHCKKQQ